ncbi:conserved hypothetical protein [Arthrobacter sp. Hiyo6]|nr:conserved hypothetical protein [Arthrobacter sp. Hiyo6]
MGLPAAAKGRAAVRARYRAPWRAGDCRYHRGSAVLETSHPPVYYLPLDSFPAGVLVPVEGATFCEFKGQAHYFDVVAGGVLVHRAGWTYPEPARGFEALRNRVALYPGQMDSCEVNGEQVTFQAGDFYGGWITTRIVGPFKGGPGTAGW